MKAFDFVYCDNDDPTERVISPAELIYVNNQLFHNSRPIQRSTATQPRIVLVIAETGEPLLDCAKIALSHEALHYNSQLVTTDLAYKRLQNKKARSVANSATFSQPSWFPPQDSNRGKSVSAKSLPNVTAIGNPPQFKHTTRRIKSLPLERLVPSFDQLTQSIESSSASLPPILAFRRESQDSGTSSSQLLPGIRTLFSQPPLTREVTYPSKEQNAPSTTLSDNVKDNSQAGGRPTC